jgi:hypothetical protein
MRRQPGDVVALRHLNAGRVSYVWPMTVVADAPDEIALYIARWSFDHGWEAWRPEAVGDVPRLREEWADVAAG